MCIVFIGRKQIVHNQKEVKIAVRTIVPHHKPWNRRGTPLLTANGTLIDGNGTAVKGPVTAVNVT